MHLTRITASNQIRYNCSGAYSELFTNDPVVSALAAAGACTATVSRLISMQRTASEPSAPQRILRVSIRSSRGRKARSLGWKQWKGVGSPQDRCSTGGPITSSSGVQECANPDDPAVSCPHYLAFCMQRSDVSFESLTQAMKALAQGCRHACGQCGPIDSFMILH